MIYILSGFIFSIFSFLEIITKDKKKFKIIFFILILFMIFFVSLRDGTIVGTDSPVYYQFYLDTLPPVEIGYKYLNTIFSNIGFQYNFFLLFINSIIMINIARFIKLNSYYLILPLFIYFSDFYYYYNFSGIRQAVAISFVALSVYYIFEGKKLYPFVLICIAATFHISSIIFLAAFFLPRQKMDMIKYIKMLSMVILATLFASYIIENIPYLNQKFLYYSTLQEQPDNILFNYYVGIIKRLMVLLAVFLVYRQFFSENKNIFLYNLYLIGFIVYVVSYLISPDFGVRFGSYFIVLDCILIAKYIYAANSQTNKVVLFLLFSSVAMYKIYTYTLIPAYDYKLLGL